jgi:hypothetical protein
MKENEGQGTARDGGQKSEAEESPSEKLEAVTPTGSLTPGAQNPESEEIKQETNPNTE